MRLNGDSAELKMKLQCMKIKKECHARQCWIESEEVFEFFLLAEEVFLIEAVFSMQGLFDVGSQLHDMPTQAEGVEFANVYV